MSRPSKYYVAFADGRASVVHGIEAARRLHAGKPAFATRDAAEEFAAWWIYEHPPWWQVQKEPGVTRHEH